MKLAICADHAGFELKEALKSAYPDIEWMDVGAGEVDPDDDYPDYAFTLAMAVAGGYAPMGIAICGTGAGMCMALNRHPYIRAAVCTDANLAKKVREHNDANVLCLPGRLVDLATARNVVDAFVNEPFSTVEKYARRNRKLSLQGDDECCDHDHGEGHDHTHDKDDGGCCGGGCH